MDIIEAAEDGNLQRVQELIRNGADVHAQDEQALIEASRYGHLPVVEYLLAHGANIHAQDDQALIDASRNGHLPVIEYLLAQGVNINVLTVEQQRLYQKFVSNKFLFLNTIRLKL